MGDVIRKLKRKTYHAGGTGSLVVNKLARTKGRTRQREGGRERHGALNLLAHCAPVTGTLDGKEARRGGRRRNGGQTRRSHLIS